MLNKIRIFWKRYGFEITVGMSIFFILILALFRIGKQGSWSQYYIDPSKLKERLGSNSNRNSSPQESKGEIECRRVLEEIFKKPFPKERPDFLRNPVTSDLFNSKNLELDCYNSDLKLAVEYNGIQHYKYIPYFHKTRDSFQNQKYRDYMKRELCKKNGIYLIEVPYTVKVPEIKDFILDKLSLGKYKI